MNKPSDLPLQEPAEKASVPAAARPASSPGAAGKPLPHESAALHVAGAAPYTDDVPELAGTLHAALGLSPVAHGVIEQLDEQADSLESQLLHKPRPQTLKRIHQLKRCVSQLRRNLHPLREVLGNLHRDADDFFGAEIQLYLRDVYDHTVHILESLEDLRDQATVLLDVYLSTVSHRVNLEVRALSVVATIFMPATLIAGVFGMNFKLMPWLEEASGFSYALGLMGCIAVVMLALFWRRKLV